MGGQLIAASKRRSHALWASPAIDQDAAALALRLFRRGRKLRHFLVNNHAFNRVKFASPRRPLLRIPHSQLRDTR